MWEIYVHPPNFSLERDTVKLSPFTSIPPLSCSSKENFLVIKDLFPSLSFSLTTSLLTHYVSSFTKITSLRTKTPSQPLTPSSPSSQKYHSALALLQANTKTPP